MIQSNLKPNLVNVLKNYIKEKKVKLEGEGNSKTFFQNDKLYEVEFNGEGNIIRITMLF